MEKEEFESWAKKNSCEHLNDIAIQHNTMVRNMYHSCKFCGYETVRIGELHEVSQIDAIDERMIEHVWVKHRAEAEKIYLKSRAEEIASKQGQARLDEI